MTDEYLTINELADRLKVAPKTVQNKMSAGIFQRGIHYFSPKGLRPRFKWSAIVAWLEERERGSNAKPAIVGDPAELAADSIPMARGYLLGERRNRRIIANRC